MSADLRAAPQLIRATLRTRLKPSMSVSASPMAAVTRVSVPRPRRPLYTA